jgi:Amt family ammonium transporter
MPFGGTKYRGRVLKTVSLSFPERLIMQRVNVYALGGVLLLTVLTGMLATQVELLVVGVAVIILFMPVRCVVTTEGVGMNNVVFRPWEDFAGFSIERRRVRLEGRDGTRALNLPLLGGNQQAILPAVRRYLKPATVSGAARPLVQHAR